MTARIVVALLLVSTAMARGQVAPRLWVDTERHPTPAAGALLASLLDIEHRGLDPADYDAQRLHDEAAALATTQTVDDSSIARFDDALTEAFVQVLIDLHFGRIDPAQLGYQLHLYHDAFDPVALAGAAVASGRISDAFDEAEPRLGQYHRIAAALVRYRSLAADTMLVPIARSREAIRPGESFRSAPQLRRWLVALGDMPTTERADSDSTYTEDLERGVRAFQQRRGIDSTGVLDPETLTALRQPMSWYVRRLELALERLRWVPDLDTGRVIVVDIPAFRLWVFDSLQSNVPPTLAMNAIVGQAFGKQTPVLDETMRSVVFRPYWDVPPTIVRQEIIPELRRNPAYLAENDMELVPETPPGEAIAALLSRRARVRQRPGIGNALGLVKFVFPNDKNIYLHDTPTQHLFAHPRRDFSHGCIRVEHPAALAQYVLSENPGWDAERIASAMQGDKTIEVELSRPIPVLVIYATAVAWPDGRVAFYPDVYGHDARLDKALRERIAPGVRTPVALEGGR